MVGEQGCGGAYEPPLRFNDARRGEAALDLVSGELWVCFRHPDGQFVTERKATQLDLHAVAELLDEACARIQTLEEALRELLAVAYEKPGYPVDYKAKAVATAERALAGESKGEVDGG